jgi:hypothetical protein
MRPHGTPAVLRSAVVVALVVAVVNWPRSEATPAPGAVLSAVPSTPCRALAKEERAVCLQAAHVLLAGEVP